MGVRRSFKATLQPTGDTFILVSGHGGGSLKRKVEAYAEEHGIEYDRISVVRASEQDLHRTDITHRWVA